jgi:hypothetical protein
MQRDHHCSFDSKVGFVNGAVPAVMCKCGNWGMRGGGVWRVVPWDYLPFACRALSQMRRACRVLRACAIALAIGFLFAMWLVPGAFK